MADMELTALESLRRLDRKAWLALGLGVLSPMSIFPVQWIARGLPLIPLGKWPAVYLSLVVAFSLAVVALVLVSRCVRSLETRPDDPLLATTVIYFGAVMLIAGLVFASVADFFKPRSALVASLPPLLVALAGLAGFLLLSSRGRDAVTSEAARRFGLEVLRYVEVITVAALILAILMPTDYDKLKALILLAEGAFFSPLVLLIACRLNRKAERYESLTCRLRSYAVALPVPVLGALVMPSL